MFCDLSGSVQRVTRAALNLDQSGWGTWTGLLTKCIEKLTKCTYLFVLCYQVKGWVAQWDISNQKVQVLLRSLHEALLDCKLRYVASNVKLYDFFFSAVARDCILKKPIIWILNLNSSLVHIMFRGRLKIHKHPKYDQHFVLDQTTTHPYKRKCGTWDHT